jgi:hypothetical protein
VKLTREQYNNLEQYLVEFRARLNQTTTREEAVPLFKEAIVELNEYGLLPKGMSVEQVQRFVIGANQDEHTINRLKRIFNLSQDDLSNDIENHFCLLVGETLNAEFLTPMLFFLLNCEMVFLFLGGMSYLFYHFIHIGFILWNFFSAICGFFDNLWLKYFTNLHCKNHLIIGCDIGYWGYYGWVETIGLNGIRTISGSLYGEIPFLLPFRNSGAFGTRGVVNFRGLKLTTNQNPNPNNFEEFYFGSALWVKIASE